VDFSQIRPAGERLKTFGGRASGPEPFKSLVGFAINTFVGSKGRRLKPIELHDILCKVGEVVVCGGVRRSALISLSDLDDQEMRDAKTGEWWVDNPQRALANNSAVHPGGITPIEFNDEWRSLQDSGSGERGIFSRDACDVPARREDWEWGTNPCSEIILRSKQFCNLSEVIVREDDDKDELFRKVRLATILGTLQAGLQDMPHLSVEWKKNTRDEALLGVSLTGIYDNQFMSTPSEDLEVTLEFLRDTAVEINRIYADRIGINQAAAVTCVKPSGTVSQLVDAASGLHPRFDEAYVRRVRMDKKDSLSRWMESQGIPCEDDFYSDGNNVFSFPITAPMNATVTDEVSAIDQLELWLVYQKYWCEHKPSVTIQVGPDEWDEVGRWVWDHRDRVSGISFLPRSDHTYRQAPYTSVSYIDAEEMMQEMPEVDFSSYREEEDNTVASQELACTGGACEVV